MSSGNIKISNFKLIDTLQGTEKIGIDRSGRLYVVLDSNFSLASAQAYFSRIGSDADQVSLEYAAAKFNEKEFQDLTFDQAQTQYLGLQKKLLALGISSKNNSGEIARIWYEKKIDNLVAQGMTLPEAIATVAQEMRYDLYLPDDYKELLASQEPFSSAAQNKYLNIQKKLAALQPPGKNNSSVLAYLWYEKKISYWMSQGNARPEATAQATCEMWHDRYVPSDYKKYIQPEATDGGTSGSYFIKDLNGKKIGVFKPQDEEIYMPNNSKGYSHKMTNVRLGPRQGHVQGSSWQKEIIAWEIDQGKMANVPPTMPIRLPFPERPGSANIFSKIGSFQLFVEGVPVANLSAAEINNIPVDQVQNVALFHLRVGNADGNSGNMLYDNKTGKLISIDHGLIFLDSMDWLENPGISETSCHWMVWPQVQQPINDRGKKWVEEYDINATEQKMRAQGKPPGSIREHKLRMIFLKLAVSRGYTIEQIGSMSMQTGPKEKVTFLDQCVMQAGSLVTDMHNEPMFFETFENILKAKL